MPVRRCECKAGNFFCAHMLSVLLLLSIIQYKEDLSLNYIVSRMPVSILTFQAMPISFCFVYGPRSTYSNRSLGEKFSAAVNRGGKKIRNRSKRIKLEKKKEEEKDEDEGTLSKFPLGWVVLADRGFAYDALKDPNFNVHTTLPL